MPGTTAERLIAEHGDKDDYRFSAAVQVKTCTTLTSEFSHVNRYEPWTNSDAKDLLKHHPIAIWRDLEVHLAPRGGVYGRMCTFYGGWAAAGITAPRTVGQMVNLHGSIDVTYGGTGDPGTVKVGIPCSFDNTMKDILKGTISDDSARPVFFYCFTEQDVVTGAKDVDRFMLTFRGSYTLHGRY